MTPADAMAAIVTEPTQPQGAAMSFTKRDMEYPPKFGMDHPTWREPSCFSYATAEEAAAQIIKVYGPDADHIVVVLQRVTSTSDADS